jgi:hypothetical protein
MVLDEVAEGLRKYCREGDADTRPAWLTRLSGTGDVRVAVALGEAMADQRIGKRSAYLLFRRYLPPAARQGDCFPDDASDWWRANEPDLRRRAAQLPR